MLGKNFLLLFCVGLITLLFVSEARVYAVLGQRLSMDVSKKRTAIFSTYRVQEVELGSTTLREYVSSSDIVFGVSWRGYVHPDLTSLLGSYLSEFQAASQSSLRKSGQRHLLVRASRVVVEKWGHMRNLQGRAYVPSLLPQGMNPNDIR